MRLRFSLRTILFSTTLLACYLYWRTRPQLVASHFKDSLAAKRFTDASTLVANLDDVDLLGWCRAAKSMEVEASFDPPSVCDWILGRRSGRYTAHVQFDRQSIAQSGRLIATATGVKVEARNESRLDLSAAGDVTSELRTSVIDPP